MQNNNMLIKLSALWQTIKKEIDAQTGLSESSFLPNFCNVKMVFAVVVVGELLAFVLTLSPFKYSDDRWGDLGMISLFIQWVGLSSTAILCLLKQNLDKQKENVAAILCLIIIVMVTAVITEISYQLTIYLQLFEFIEEHWHWKIHFRNISIATIVSAFALRYFYIQHQWKNQIESVSEARIQALQARIQPHFLFNSMNTIAYLTRINPDLAEQAIEDLSDLFRQSLVDSHNLITLDKELELARTYLRIEKLRLDHRLNVNWNMDNIPSNTLIPALVIQPLLENAIRHGIERLELGGTIHINGTIKHRMVQIHIANPIGESVQDTHGHNIALENIRKRLVAHFGPRSNLIVKNSKFLFEVTLAYPYTQ